MSDVMTKENELKGEKLSFFQLFNNKKWDICIPIIQRDYAQGRVSAESVRAEFLDTLKTHLTTNTPIDLDFVYGSIDQTNQTQFAPLDGQQRLTTLFLLHWYLARKDNKVEDFKSLMLKDKKSKFFYKTRNSAEEFCDALVSNIDDLKIFELSLSEQIKDQSWYFNSWDYDSTIQSMLVMLDAIDDIFRDTFDGYDKLTRNDNPVITFQLLNMEGSGLTDELYIKMNARGKPLTQFENFKAKFEQFLKEDIFSGIQYVVSSKNFSTHDYFAHRIDTKWADLFWNFRNKLTNYGYFDDEFMNFFRSFIISHYTVKEVDDEKVKAENLKKLVGEKKSRDHISIQNYITMGCWYKEIVVDIITLLDIVSKDKELKTYLNNYFYYNETEMFKKIISNNLELQDRLRFYAYYLFILKNKDCIDEKIEKLKAWMRIVYNLTENTEIRFDNYINAAKSIKFLIAHLDTILEYFAKNKEVTGFLQLQINEERVKASLILKSQDWKDKILIAEQHPYFKGQIGFLLNFSGIIFNHNTLPGSYEEPNLGISFKNFSEYLDKSQKLFNQDGVIAELKNDKYFWYRALLNKGDYLLSSGKYWSFLVDHDRDVGWKRLLRNDNNGRREIIKKLMDDSDFNQNDLCNSLLRIINNSTVTDWREVFIKYPDFFANMGDYKLLYRIERLNTQPIIYLLTGQQLGEANGGYIEYYSYIFYQKYLKNKLIHPFTRSGYYVAHGLYNSSVAYIDIKEENADERYAIDIGFDTKSSRYYLKFFIRGNKIIEDDIQKKLMSLGFTKKDTADTSELYCENLSEDEANKKLNELSSKLFEILLVK